MRLILVRHGLSEWNASGRVQGQADPPLSPAGREEARRLGPMVVAQAPEAVVSSDLVRARETAELLGAGPVETDPRWRESAMGDWTGRAADELLADPSGAFVRWREGLEPPPGGESFDDMRARAGAAVRDLLARGRSARWWSRTAARCVRRSPSSRAWRPGRWCRCRTPA